MKTLRTLIALSALLFTLPGFGQNHAADATLTTNPVYQKSCAKCHGKTAEGRHFGGPALVSDKVAAESADDVRVIITDGKGRMPKFSGKLTPEEIVTLVEQIQAANKK